MKKAFINFLMKDFIKSKDYMPVKDENGNIMSGDKVNILLKKSFESLIILELIDADMMSADEIRLRMENSARRLIAIEDNAYQYVFGIFVFDGEADSEKLKAISSGQLHNSIQKKFIKTISVNMQDRSIYNHSDTSQGMFDMDIIIKRQLDIFKKGIISDESVEDIVYQKQRDYRFELKAKIPFVTYVLIAINILVWLAISIYGQRSGVDYNDLLGLFGAKDNGLIIKGEYWRFFTPIFLHADRIHLLSNCLSLYVLGRTAELIFGNLKFTVIYILAGIIGNIASFCFSPNTAVGASGAIFGIMGAMLYFGLERPALFKAYFGRSILPVIIMNLFIGFSLPNIDNFAHIGGLIGGFLTTGAVRGTTKSFWYLNRHVYIIAALVVSSSGVVYGFNSEQNQVSVLLTQMQQAEESDNWGEIEKNAEKILSLEPKGININTYVLSTLANAENMLGKYYEGIEHAKQLKQLDPKYGHYVLGILYFNTKQYDMAEQELLEAKRLGAEYKDIDEIIDRIAYQTRTE